MGRSLSTVPSNRKGLLEHPFGYENDHQVYHVVYKKTWDGGTIKSKKKWDLKHAHVPGYDKIDESRMKKMRVERRKEDECYGRGNKARVALQRFSPGRREKKCEKMYRDPFALRGDQAKDLTVGW